ncbi:MAG TPA: PepSY domain-containing protein [Sphingobium sp.]|uniref:PepSY domain-containing protein n=1 Tax=Sphingobium sp. TaxID=1912891 RepID=UPI002ED0D1CE
MARTYLLKTGKRWLYLVHRWMGIALCVLFAIWFVSGVVMMYVPFPSFRGPERVASAPPIDWSKVRVDPGAALARLHLDDFPDEMRLGMTAGEPVYRFVTDDGRRAVSAATGQEVGPISARKAGTIASVFAHASVLSTEPVEHDQWVVTKAYKKMGPFWRVRMDDPVGTDLYIAQKTGEIVQNTTTHERFWNWLGAVPHWIYFEALRLHQEPWRQTVLWTSGIGILGAVAGMWIGILRVRIRRKYRSGSVSPYRGWMKWHHIVGLVGGVFLVTWIFSGWLSMSPWGGLRDKGGDHIGALYRGARVDYPAVAPTRIARPGASELRFGWFGGKPVILALSPSGAKAMMDANTGQAFVPAKAAILNAARMAMPGAPLISAERLIRPDSYWYTTGDPRRDERPLPIFRLKFADKSLTWLHVDPATGELLGQMGSGSRSYRWLFSALHSFDIPLLLQWRPLRDRLMWLFSAAGLLISVSGIVIGWRHLTRSRPRPPGRRKQPAETMAPPPLR